jgi:hypothetical protein
MTDQQSFLDAPASDTFDFAFQPGESVGDRHARCWEEALAGGRMGQTLRAGFYRSFLNATTPAGYVGDRPQEDISSWKTSCLITQQATLHHCGWPNPPNGPPVMGAGFHAVLGDMGPPYFQKAGEGMTPSRGDILYWASTGTDGHVECLLGIDPDGTWNTAGGGHGDGTQCCVRALQDGRDPSGRPLQGWWKITEMGLPPSP